MSKATTKYIPTVYATGNPRPLTRTDFFEEWAAWGGDLKLAPDAKGNRRVLTSICNEKTDAYFDQFPNTRKGAKPIAKRNPDWKGEEAPQVAEDQPAQRLAQLKDMTDAAIKKLAKENKLEVKSTDKIDDIITNILLAEFPENT